MRHPSQYALGHTDEEHERLMRQAARYDPLTERVFQEAGLGSGQRVLELGSGVGDVAMLAARLVGASGEIVGVERDTHSIAMARDRVAKAGLSNVRFIQSDVREIPRGNPFNAAIGRFILQFVPDPVALLQSALHLVHPGGIIAFQEISWAPFLKLSEHMPLVSACARLAHETLRRSGAHTDMGLALHRVFTDAGLPAPTVRLEMVLGNDTDLTRWIYDILKSLQPQIVEQGRSFDDVGDMDTLQERIHAEVVASRGVMSSPGIVGAWCRV